MNENFEWLDGIRAILSTNGFGNVWNNPLSVNKDTFHKIFRQRMHDQYIQDLKRKIESSNRFTLLHTLTGDISVFKIKSYINLIKSPDIRNIYTRLRIDCHMLETSQPKLHKSSNGFCKNCNMNRLETPEHLLLHCEKFSASRQTAYDNISKIDAAFSNMDELRRIKYFLNLQCPEECPEFVL